jgi:2,4-diketo-3-deoxy-L-fuconate hydrolase
MHICRFNGDRLGLVENGIVYDVSDAVAEMPRPRWPYPAGDPLVANLDRIMDVSRSLRDTAKGTPVAKVSLNSPITSPTKIIGAPVNYPMNLDAADPAVRAIVNTNVGKIDRPVEKLGFFLKAISSVVGPSEGISLSWPGRPTYHEVELAVVIGRKARNIQASDALGFIGAYCLALDMTVIGPEDRSFRKSADSYTVLGPWLTDGKAVKDAGQLDLWLEVNGERRQHSSTAGMTVGIARLIELASSAYSLYPGDVILTGTPDGVGAVKPGDVIRAGCEGIGEMTVAVR